MTKSIIRVACIALIYVNRVFSFHSGWLRSKALSKTLSPSSAFIHSTKLSVKDADQSLDWDPKMAPKLDFNEDYYKVLELNPKCDEKQLKKGYYKMVSKYHPDGKYTPEEKDLANKQMMVINAAYRILKESNLRIMYDAQRSQGLYGARSGVKSGKDGVVSSQSPKNTAASKPRSTPPPRSSTGASSAGRTYSTTDSFQDMFNDFFGRGDYDQRAAEREQHQRQQAAQEAYARRVEEYEASFRNKAREKLHSNVDAALDRLISQYWSLAAKKEELENHLLRDQRDWGSPNINPKDVQKRLEDLEEYKFLTKQVKKVEDEVASRVYPNPVHAYLNRYKNDGRGSSNNSGRRYSWSRSVDESDVDDYYNRPPPPPPSRRQYYGSEGSSPQPQPQPQWQRASNPPPRRTQTYGEGMGEGGGYQTWREDQRRRRSGYTGRGADDFDPASYRSSEYEEDEDEDVGFDLFNEQGDDNFRHRKSSSTSPSQVYRSQAREVIRDFSAYNKKFSSLLTDSDVIDDVAALLQQSDESRRFANAADRIDPYNLYEDDDFFTGRTMDDLGDSNFEKELASAILKVLAARLGDSNSA